ncbi:hypothetical protein C4556_02630 [Candidatus Parcubacteria bacterium]|nr:MAG: hypothetical protein C4556_02630 [Candidatus Parcubacteria bacterium]
METRKQSERSSYQLIVEVFRFGLLYALAAALLLFAAPAVAEAQVATTPYWCGSYYSSSPCSTYGYGYGNYPSYSYQYYYPYNYQQYPYYYPYTYPRPTCVITVSYPYALYYGYYNQPVTLSWSSINATSAYIYPNVGAVSTSGSTTVYPSQGTTYTLTVNGPGGSNTCQTTYYQQTPYYQYPYNYWYPHYYYGY